MIPRRTVLTTSVLFTSHLLALKPLTNVVTDCMIYIMQRRLHKKKVDLNELATTVVEQATTDLPAEEPQPVDPTKDPNAVALGLKGGSKGGKARAKNMTAKQRSEAARKAALARWRTK
jgi:hypothetical protein